MSLLIRTILDDQWSYTKGHVDISKGITIGELPHEKRYIFICSIFLQSI